MLVEIPSEVLRCAQELSKQRRFPGAKTPEEMGECLERSVMLQMHIGDIVAAIVLKQVYGTLDAKHS